MSFLIQTQKIHTFFNLNIETYMHKEIKADIKMRVKLDKCIFA